MTVNTVQASEDPSLLADVEAHFRKYVVTDSRYLLVVSLWAIATHLFSAFDAFPYLAITSPTKRCGKTRLAELLEMVGFNPWRTVGATPAVIFRTVDRDKPTLIMDEAEVLNTKEERSFALREILNAGYRKGQTVSRCDDRNGHEPRKFQTYCPKAFILIGSLTGPLSDRCLEIRMQRKLREQIERFRFARVLKESSRLKKAIIAWAKGASKYVAAWFEKNGLDFLEDREEELWLPLFAVCTVLALERLPELQRIAKEMAESKARAEPTDCGVSLLRDIRQIVFSRKIERITTRELIIDLQLPDDAPWREWNNGNGLTARDVAKLLKPFGIYSRNLRNDSKVSKGYDASSFRDAWERYLPPCPQNCATTLQSA